MRILYVFLIVNSLLCVIVPALFVAFGDPAKRKAHFGVFVLSLPMVLLQVSILRGYADTARDEEEPRIKHAFRYKCQTLNEATLTPGEKDAIALLRRIEVAEEAYIAKYRTLADLKALADEGLIEADPKIEGYKISLVHVSPKSGAYSITAESRGISFGKCSFNLSDDGVVRFQGGFVAPRHLYGCPVFLGPA